MLSFEIDKQNLYQFANRRKCLKGGYDDKEGKKTKNDSKKRVKTKGYESKKKTKKISALGDNFVFDSACFFSSVHRLLLHHFA